LDLTILIPTLNRPAKLKRALGFLDREKFQGVVRIGDSGTLPDRFFDNLNLNIVYDKYPDAKHDGEVMKDMISKIDTTYAIQQGDDDLMLPKGFDKCIKFLEEHPDYSAVRGIRINVHYSNRGLCWALPVNEANAEQDSPVERWKVYMENGRSVQSYVQRTETWKRMYRDVDKVPSRYLGPELLPCSISFINGKTKVLLDVLSFIFEMDSEDRMVDWAKKDMFDYMHSKEWLPSYKQVRKSIIKELIENGIAENEAEDLFNREIRWHIVSALGSQWKRRYEPLPGKMRHMLFSNMMNPLWEQYSEFRKAYTYALTWESL